MRTAISRDLTRNLENTQQEIFYIIRERVDTLMGLDESWHQVSLLGVLQPVMASVNHRMLVGTELCHNKTFTESLGIFSTLLGSFDRAVCALIPGSGLWERILLGYLCVLEKGFEIPCSRRPRSH